MEMLKRVNNFELVSVEYKAGEEDSVIYKSIYVPELEIKLNSFDLLYIDIKSEDDETKDAYITLIERRLDSIIEDAVNVRVNSIFYDSYIRKATLVNMHRKACAAAYFMNQE